MAAQSNPSSSSSKKLSFPLNSSPPPPFSGGPTCGKLPISSLLASAFSGGSSNSGSSSSTAACRKMPFKVSTFRGLGCRSVAEVSAPETVVRASADWQVKSAGKKKKKKKQGPAGSGVVAPDVWCKPGVGLAADVDCVVARRPAGNFSGGGRADGEVEVIFGSLSVAFIVLGHL